MLRKKGREKAFKEPALVGKSGTKGINGKCPKEKLRKNGR